MPLMLTGISSSNRCFSHFAAGEEPRLLAMASQDGNKDKAVTLNPVIRSVAGSLGGVTEACFLQPMDVIKTRLQLDKAGKYTGVYNCGSTIIREEGARSLWKGLTPFAGNLTLKYFLRFGTNAFYQNLLRDADGKLSDVRRMAAGFSAGVTEALIIVTPFEVVKIRLQQQHGMDSAKLLYKGPIHCAATIVREEGPRGLWSGASPTVLRNGTNQMCLFWAKNHMDGVLWGKHDGDGKQLAAWQSMVSGFSAACLGPTVTNPFDVIKTRMMAQKKSPEGIQYSGFFDALIKIPRQEGIKAMYKGLLPRLMRIPPGQAIVWTVSDQVTGFFERRKMEELAQSLPSTGRVS